jgi:hypothetical protein
MAATESSVVVALKEVRRLEIERQRREEENRRAAQEEAAREGGASVQYGPGIVPFGANGWSTEGLPEGFARPVHRTSEVMPIASSQGFGQPQSYVAQQTLPAWEGPGFANAPVKKRSLIPAILVTAALCSAAAFGYVWTLKGEYKAELSRQEAARQRIELVKNEAVAARSKAEQ